MNELVKVNPDTMEVSARDLYKALGLSKRFSISFRLFPKEAANA